MKKLIYLLLLILMVGVFSSCQKGENFFNGTWQAVQEYEYWDEDGHWHLDVCTIELTLEKKSGEARWEVDRPKDPSNNILRDGTYKFYNDNTVAVTFPKVGEMNEWTLLLQRLPEDNHRLYANGYDYGYYYFTKIRN